MMFKKRWKYLYQINSLNKSSLPYGLTRQRYLQSSMTELQKKTE